jgi:hypothetical protein
MPPYERRNTRLNSNPSKTGARGERTAYLKLEKPCFLFLEGSGGATVAPVVVAVALASAPVAPAGTFVARTTPSTNRPTAGAPAPATGASSSAASAALGDGGGGFHLSEGGPPPVALLLLLLLRR